MKLIEKIKMILIILLVISFNMYIGIPLIRMNNTIIHLIITSIFGIYLIINLCIKNRIKIIENIVDVLFLLFCLTPMIPLIPGSFVTLNGTIDSVLKSINIFFVYIIFKNEFKQKENISKILKIVVFSSLIPIILGFDLSTKGVFLPILQKLNIVEDNLTENRMVSIFGYSNAFSIYLSSILFVAIYLYNLTKNKYIKSLFSTYIILNIFCLIYSFSRASILLLGIFIIIYFILNRKKLNIIENVWFLGINSIIAFLCTELVKREILNVWLIFILSIIVSFVLHLIYLKLREKIKISNKTINITSAVIGVLVIIFLIAGLYIKAPLSLFEESNIELERTRIANIKPNQYYEFEFDLKIETDKQTNRAFAIIIKEKNNLTEEKEIGKVILDSEVTKKITIPVNTSSDLKELNIMYKKLTGKDDSKLIVENLNINGKTKILNYKYLPHFVYDLLNTVNFNTQSVWERKVYFNDGLKLVKDNLFAGIGGNGWKYAREIVQEYNYAANYVHCFPLKVLMENGIFAFILLVLIICKITIKVIKYLIKNNNNENYNLVLTIFITGLLVFIHSLIDFDMEFMCINILLTMYLAIINNYLVKNETNDKKIINNIMICISVIATVILFIMFTKEIIADTMFKKEKLDTSYTTKYVCEKAVEASELVPYSNKYKEVAIMHLNNYLNQTRINESNIQDLKQKDKIFENYTVSFIKNEPYKSQNVMNNHIANRIKNLLNANNIAGANKYIVLLYNQMDKNALANKYSLADNVKRVEIYSNVITSIREKQDQGVLMYNNFKQIFEKEYYTIFNNIEEYDINQQYESYNSYKERLQSLYETVNK